VNRAGYTLVELLFVTALIATVSAVALPGILATVDDARAIGATRYLSSRLQHARMESVMRSADVGLRFVPAGKGYSYTTYVDGNGNGIRTVDILSGVDWPLRPAERLPDFFYGVDFGVLPGLPPVESGGAPPGADPVKVGASNILTFSAIGSSSSGSLYLLGQSGAQYVIRIFGVSGKTRVLKFNSQTYKWKPL
jgi:prepilin-type N-terminal cleavage/methylation domain-containing protein